MANVKKVEKEATKAEAKYAAPGKKKALEKISTKEHERIAKAAKKPR